MCSMQRDITLLIVEGQLTIAKERSAQQHNSKHVVKLVFKVHVQTSADRSGVALLEALFAET
jgi:hypothetical protein